MIPRSTAPTLLALSAACGGPDLPPPDGPHIVVVCIDTLRADHTSLHGYARRTTPNLERIAAEGLVLENHFANASWTKPSVATMITGLHPTAHGSRAGEFRFEERHGEQPWVEVLADEHVTLAEALSDHGYATCAHVTNYNMLSKFGYAQGYDDYEFVMFGNALDSVNAMDRKAIEYAKKKLRKARRPTFAWVHLMSVHQYVAPPDERPFSADGATPIDTEAPAHARVSAFPFVEDAVASYDNSILYADGLVGDLWDFLRAEVPNTVLIVTSDHGEEFGEHGGYEHGTSLYNELLRIPCVAAGPGVPVGRVTGLTDSVDLYPTVLAIAGIEPKPGLEGRPLWGGEGRSDGKLATFGEQHHRGARLRLSVVHDGRKLIYYRGKRTGAQGYEFYPDGLAIEGEDARDETAKSVMKPYLDHVLEFERRMKAYFEEHVGGARRRDLGATDLEHLRDIGYVGDESDD